LKSAGGKTENRSVEYRYWVIAKAAKERKRETGKEREKKSNTVDAATTISFFPFASSLLRVFAIKSPLALPLSLILLSVVSVVEKGHPRFGERG
jgi:hypothetical protein